MNDIHRGIHHLNKAIKFLSATAVYEIEADYYNSANLTKEINRLILIEKRLNKYNQKRSK